MENLRHDLRQILADDKILDNELWREIYARDASYFKILPQAVVRPRSVAEVQKILALAHRRGLGVTFRTEAHRCQARLSTAV